jgi:hypothetical protein
LRVKIIPNLPIYKATTLSSILLKPKIEFVLTSFKHFAHLCMADFVRLTRTGNMINPINPNSNIDNTVIKYPIKDGLYSTIELLTASQKGHFTFVDLKIYKLRVECRTILHKNQVHLFLIVRQ